MRDWNKAQGAYQLGLQQFTATPEMRYTRHQDTYRDAPTIISPVSWYIDYLYFIVYI